MDALTHAIEAYIGVRRPSITRAMSEEAATLIVRSLYKAYQNGGDMDAAAICSARHTARAYPLPVPMSAMFTASPIRWAGSTACRTGCANAVILPYFLDAYGSACHKKLGRLARIAALPRSLPTTATQAKRSSAGFAR